MEMLDTVLKSTITQLHEKYTNNEITSIDIVDYLLRIAESQNLDRGTLQYCIEYVIEDLEEIGNVLEQLLDTVPEEYKNMTLNLLVDVRLGILCS